jgi:hypothetical protein
MLTCDYILQTVLDMYPPFFILSSNEFVQCTHMISFKNLSGLMLQIY